MTLESNPSTNYLNPGLYKDFLDSIPKLEIYHSPYASHAALTPYGFKLLFMFCYYCALRISEALDVVKDDIDLERRILRVPRAKTGRRKGKMKSDGTQKIEFLSQKTSIPMPLLKELKENWDKLPSKLFDVSRQTAWAYGKKIGEIAHLNLFESQDKREIKGVWTHLFRKSYAKMMYENDAKGALIDVKLRHDHKSKDMADSTFTYIKPDINALIAWEVEHFGN